MTYLCKYYNYIDFFHYIKKNLSIYPIKATKFVFVQYKHFL